MAISCVRYMPLIAETVLQRNVEKASAYFLRFALLNSMKLWRIPTEGKTTFCRTKSHVFIP